MHIWEKFMMGSDAVEQLNQDMHDNGLAYSVPEALQPIFERILKSVFLTQPDSASERVLRRARCVLAQIGFHFFSTVCRKRTDSATPLVLNGLQTRFAMLIKEGKSEHALREAHDAGITIAQSTADQKLDDIAKRAEENLQIDFTLSQFCWRQSGGTVLGAVL